MSEVVIRKNEFDAVIFDLDGVITKTADVHEAAWAELFNGYLRERADRGGDPFEPFSTADYGRYVDGKPRYDGVQSFLQSRGIDLPWGGISSGISTSQSPTTCGNTSRRPGTSSFSLSTVPRCSSRRSPGSGRRRHLQQGTQSV